MQQDKKRSTASPASTDGKAEYEPSSFDLTTREGLESYWAQLAQMSVDYRSVDGTPKTPVHPTEDYCPGLQVASVHTSAFIKLFSAMLIFTTHNALMQVNAK